MSIMHVFVQCPRLSCLVRQAIMYPEDSNSLAAAVTLAESMWQIDLPAHVTELIQNSVTIVDQAPSLNMADILSVSLHFDSVQNMILCTRYWMLQNVMCGLTDTLHRHFPAQIALSLLPTLTGIQEVDIEAGIRLAESLEWAESVSQTLPLVPLRLHTPLQISIGPWHRLIRHLASTDPSEAALDGEFDEQAFDSYSRATRMRAWLIGECNRIHELWNVSTVDEKSLYEALDSMAGEEIPDWLPTRIRFEAEDGDMVIKLDYEKATGSHQDKVTLADERSISHLPGIRVVDGYASETNSHETQDTVNDAEAFPRSAGLAEIVIPIAAESPQPEPSDFLFKSGRNLCSTSGWWPTSDNPATPMTDIDANVNPTFGPRTASSRWPQTPRPSVLLLDSTHKTSAFQQKTKQRNAKAAVTFDNKNLNGCMSPAWTSTSGTVKPPTPSDGGGGANSTSSERSFSA